MPRKKQSIIAVNPVAWNGKTGAALKYQAVAKGKAVRIFSDPKPSKEAAVLSLLHNCRAFASLAATAVEQAAELIDQSSDTG